MNKNDLQNIIKDGDIIFQTSTSSQSKALQEATNSLFSHCGIIYKTPKGSLVFEAVNPVKLTPIETWISRGKNSSFVIKRLRNADEILNEVSLNKMKGEGENFNHKNYDLAFKWDDNEMYCSELVWKIYNRALGLEIGKIQKFRDLNLDGEEIKKLIDERYHKKNEEVPLDMIVITPDTVFKSDLLIEVVNTYG